MIKLRSFYKLALYIGFSSSISACFSSANPKILKKTATEKTIETYLNDLVNQDKQAAKKLFCVPSKYSAYLKRHKYDVNTFEILNVEPGLLKNSDLEYDQVYVRQNVTKRNGERQIQKRHYAVWNTEDNYQYMTERYREYAKNPNKKMDRQKWSFNPKCISHYSDMSDSYHLLPINHRLKFSNESKKSASDNPDMYREYGQIEPGMTINNAKKILKDYSVEKKTGSDGRVFYIWKVPKGKYFIVVRSLDDKVKSKSIRYY